MSAALLDAAGFTVRVDPVAGEVRVEGDVPAEVAAALTERYGRAVVVTLGGSATTGDDPRPARGGPRTGVGASVVVAAAAARAGRRPRVSS